MKKYLTQGSPLQWRRFPVNLLPPEVMHSHTDCILLLLVTVFVPGETLLIEGYDYLWALMIGFLGEHEISLIRVFPARHKDQSLSLELAQNCASLHKLDITLLKCVIHQSRQMKLVNLLRSFFSPSNFIKEKLEMNRSD